MAPCTGRSTGTDPRDPRWVPDTGVPRRLPHRVVDAGRCRGDGVDDHLVDPNVAKTAAGVAAGRRCPRRRRAKASRSEYVAGCSRSPTGASRMVNADSRTVLLAHRARTGALGPRLVSGRVSAGRGSAGDRAAGLLADRTSCVRTVRLPAGNARDRRRVRADGQVVRGHRDRRHGQTGGGARRSWSRWAPIIRRPGPLLADPGTFSSAVVVAGRPLAPRCVARRRRLALRASCSTPATWRRLGSITRQFGPGIAPPGRGVPSPGRLVLHRGGVGASAGHAQDSFRARRVPRKSR